MPEQTQQIWKDIQNTLDEVDNLKTQAEETRQRIREQEAEHIKRMIRINKEHKEKMAIYATLLATSSVNSKSVSKKTKTKTKKPKTKKPKTKTKKTNTKKKKRKY